MSEETYRKVFNGIKRLRQEAIDKYQDPFNQTDIRLIDLSNDDIIKLYYEESQKSGAWLKVNDFKDNKKLPCYCVVRKRIGGVEVLREEALKKFGQLAK